MIDCSRNGVLLPSAVKFLLRQLALMGTNVLQLYCEDTYEIDGEPFFGYFRGPYTEAELREIDDYAFSLGIEIIACIQTLGHLGQMLQWPKYGGLRDTAEVLLAESAETYTFIEKVCGSLPRDVSVSLTLLGMTDDQSYQWTPTIQADSHRYGRGARSQRREVPPALWLQGVDQCGQWLRCRRRSPPCLTHLRFTVHRPLTALQRDLYPQRLVAHDLE